MEKTINGIRVELVPGLTCNRCLFKRGERGNRTCITEDNDCLSVKKGGWREATKPETLNEIITKDPLFQ
jgi:hypothetical protein